MPTPRELRELALTFLDEVYVKGNLGHVDEAFADDFVEHQELPDLPPTRDGMKAAMRMLTSTTSGREVEVVRTVASGDRIAVAARYSATDTGGVVPGAPPTGRRYTIDGIDVLRVNERGAVVEHWAIADVVGAMEQLGAAANP